MVAVVPPVARSKSESAAAKPESMMTPPAVASTIMASASVEAPVTRISVAVPIAVMSKSSPARSPVTEMLRPPAVVVICMASSAVPAAERIRLALTAPI